MPDANATLRRLRRVQPQAYGGPFWDGHALYGPDSSFGILRSPEQQFVDVLVQRKLDAIRKGAEDAQRFFTHRLQLQVVLLDINPPMFRRLVSWASHPLILPLRSAASSLGTAAEFMCG